MFRCKHIEAVETKDENVYELRCKLVNEKGDEKMYTPPVNFLIKNEEELKNYTADVAARINRASEKDPEMFY